MSEGILGPGILYTPSPVECSEEEVAQSCCKGGALDAYLSHHVAFPFLSEYLTTNKSCALIETHVVREGMTDNQILQEAAFRDSSRGCLQSSFLRPRQMPWYIQNMSRSSHSPDSNTPWLPLHPWTLYTTLPHSTPAALYLIPNHLFNKVIIHSDPPAVQVHLGAHRHCWSR